MEIDGIRVQPVLARLDFYGLDFKDFAQQAARRKVSAVSARVGVILSYNTIGPPGHVKVSWDKFNWQVYGIRSTVFAYDQTLVAELFNLTPDAQRFLHFRRDCRSRRR